jgi:hypothetical protein
LHFYSSTSISIFFVDTQSATTQVQNIRITNLSFSSTLYTNFSEHVHFVNVNGVKNLIIEKCFFTQFRGDAIYIGAGVGPNIHITHNERITIKECEFDGVNNENRNAISVLDCNQLLIENNIFKNATRSNMPGAIDIEPNDSGSTLTEVLKDIVVQNNSFQNIGGGAGSFSIFLPPRDFVTPPSGIYFINNVLENVSNGFLFVNRYIPSGGIDVKSKMPFYVKNNVFKNVTQYAFRLMGACGGEISGNYFNSGNTSLIGYLEANEISTDVIVSGNYFDKCGSVSGTGLNFFNCKRIKLRSNTFNDCGTGNPAQANAINFNGNATFPCSSDVVYLEENLFLTPTGKTLVAIQRESNHTITNPGNNRYLNNFLSTLNPTPAAFLYGDDQKFGNIALTITSSNTATIPHTLGFTPKFAIVQPRAALPAGINISFITVNNTNIIVTFSSSFSASVNLWWFVQP